MGKGKERTEVTTEGGIEMRLLLLLLLMNTFKTKVPPLRVTADV